MANRLFLYLLIFGANSLKAQNPIVYLSFDDWPLVKLDGGKLICTDYVNIFTDEFNSSIQFDKNWNKYMGNNPDCGLAHGSGSVFSETNVILDTAAITGGITGQVELYVTKTSTTGDIDCDSNVTNYITREYTGGVIQKSADQAFNLGRYKFRFKFPMQNKIWSAFWMFHNGIEIDMIDNGYSSNVNHNVFQNDLANQIFNSPCSPFFSECNFCPTPQGIDCYSSNATCAGITENHYNWDCMYLAEGFHELICEWTPYQISFSIDGYETGTVYRYYDLDKNPLKIACGDLIPEIVVKENPAFASRVKDTYMLPIIWTSTACNQNNSDTASCNQTGAVILDNFIVDERVYQVLSLLPEPLCYKLCNNENICINIKQYPLNFMYSKSNSLFNPLPPITVSSWNLTSPNAVITSSNDHSICIEYTGTSCSNPTSCQEKVCFEANYSSPGFPSGSIIKCLYPPQEPKFYSQCSSFIEASKENQNESKKCLCVDLGNNCDALVLLDNQPVPSSPTGGLICYDRANPCINMDVTIDNCGNTISYSS